MRWMHCSIVIVGFECLFSVAFKALRGLLGDNPVGIVEHILLRSSYSEMHC
jgi:hypothetical protein